MKETRLNQKKNIYLKKDRIKKLVANDKINGF